MHAINILLASFLLSGLQVFAHPGYEFDWYNTRDLDARDPLEGYELVERYYDFGDDDLHARDYFDGDHDLYGREYDEVYVFERDFDDGDLEERDFDYGNIYERDFFDFELDERAAVGGPFQILFDGNARFRSEMGAQLNATSREKPHWLYMGCSDSHVSEGTIFNAKPGSVYAHRNLGNQFHATDANAHSVLSYAVDHLGIKHILVMGHYGCGGVAAAISPKAQPHAATDVAVQEWIAPIREILRTSNRTEIVQLRNKIQTQKEFKPALSDSGFRALVEENVKASVRRLAAAAVLKNRPNTQSLGLNYAPGAAGDVFVHGFVYNPETGHIHNLGVSVGPAGKAVPEVPFPKVQL